MAKKDKTLHELRIMTLRRASTRWKYRYACLNAAKVYVDIGKYKNGNNKTGVFFICAECERQGIEAYYKRNEVQVDHVKPIVDVEEGFTGWDDYVPNLLCEGDNLQVLCRKCHKEKTNAENEARRTGKKSIDTKRQKGYTKTISQKKNKDVKKT